MVGFLLCFYWVFSSGFYPKDPIRVKQYTESSVSTMYSMADDKSISHTTHSQGYG
jgi:hypothetical protein